MSKIRRSSMLIPTPDTYAKASVGAIGHSGKISPYWAHAIYYGLLTLVPSWILAPIIMNVTFFKIPKFAQSPFPL